MVAKKTALKTIIKGLGPVGKARLVVQSNLEELCGRPALIDDADLRLIHTSLDATQGRQYNDYLNKSDRLDRYVTLLAEKVWRLKAALYERDRILWSVRTAQAIVEDRGFAKTVPDHRLDRNHRTVVPPGIELTRHELSMEPTDKPHDTNTSLTYWQADLTPGMEEILQEMVDDIRQEAAELKPHLLKARGLAEELALKHHTTRVNQLEDTLANHDVVLEDLVQSFANGTTDPEIDIVDTTELPDGLYPVPTQFALVWDNVATDQVAIDSTHRE